MRYAIITDIHANLEAFQAVLDRIEDLCTDRILCLGDVVGYNADPNACVEIVRMRQITCLLGNHDAVACGHAEPHTFTPLAREAVLWTRNQLTPVNRAFLCALPRQLLVDGLFLCHGTINDTNQYIFTENDVRKTFRLMEQLPDSPRICFHGHSHLPSAYRSRDNVTAREAGDTLIIDPSASYLVNPGSVGQPRDGDPRSAFVLYDDESARLKFFRIDYDRETCQNKIMAAGLPDKLALRLELGR